MKQLSPTCISAILATSCQGSYITRIRIQTCSSLHARSMLTKCKIAMAQVVLIFFEDCTKRNRAFYSLKYTQHAILPINQQTFKPVGNKQTPQARVVFNLSRAAQKGPMSQGKMSKVDKSRQNRPNLRQVAQTFRKVAQT